MTDTQQIILAIKYSTFFLSLYMYLTTYCDKSNPWIRGLVQGLLVSTLVSYFIRSL